MRSVILVACLISALALGSCSPASDTANPTTIPISLVTPPATETAIPTPTAVMPTPTPAPVPTVAVASGVTIDAIFSRTAALRGLPAKQRVPLNYIDRDELRPHLIKMFEKEHARDDLEKDKAALVLLELLDEKDDLYELWLGLLEEQVAGFFEFDSQQMTLVRNQQSLSALDELTLSHEYVHALQDQHFGVGAKQERLKDDDDRSLALQSLGEGDATLAMVQYARQHFTLEQLTSLGDEAGNVNMDKLQSAPMVLQINLLFPYEQGTNFVGEVFHSKGWAGIDGLYDRLPESTEHILHPEKYLAGEAPQRVEMPNIAAVLGSEWMLFDSSTFGELGWMIYLLSGLDPDEAMGAAAGWDGDRYQLLRSSDGQYALAVFAVWDTLADAEELHAATRAMQKSRPGAKVISEADLELSWEGAVGFGHFEVRSNKTLLVVAPNQDIAKKIRACFAGF